MTAKTEKVLKKLITMSRKLKAQGHDLFVSYSPHCDMVDWSLHIGGWDGDMQPDFKHYGTSIEMFGDKPHLIIEHLNECLKKSKIKIGK